MIQRESNHGVRASIVGLITSSMDYTHQDKIDRLEGELKDEQEANKETESALKEALEALDEIYSIAKRF